MKSHDKFLNTYEGDKKFNYTKRKGEEGMMDNEPPHSDRVKELHKSEPKRVWSMLEDEDEEIIVVTGYKEDAVMFYISINEWQSQDESYYWGH